MKYVTMGAGTILAFAFIALLVKGKKYSVMVENLDKEKYPLCSLYIEGLALSSFKLFALRGKKRAELKQQASLLYEPQYSDYYSSIVWAQTLTLVHLFLALTFLLASILADSKMLLLTAGTFISVFAAVYCLENMKNMISARTEECESQLRSYQMCCNFVF